MNLLKLPSTLAPSVSNIQSSTRRMLPYWISAAITALFSVVYARVFGWSEKIAFDWSEVHPLWAFFMVPSSMMLSTALAQWISPLAAGSGIPQLLAAVEISREPTPLMDRLLSLRMIAVKFVGSCLCIAGGGITGREGPMLQISAGIFNQVQKLWPKLAPREKVPNIQSMILAGGAAGLASAFNTPLGGIIFAIEELAKVHISQIRTYVFHAVIIAGLLAQAILGNYLYFGKIELAAPKSQEIIPLIFAAALIGVLGALFAKAVIALLDWRSQKRNWQKYSITCVLGLLMATLFYFFGRNAIGSGRDVIVNLLSENQNPASFSLGWVRGFGNLFTYAGGVVGGIFAPALSTGAAFGSWLSSFGHEFHHQVWVLAGMVAFLTGLTRTPFTSLILVLEMTDTHDVIIVLMLAAIIAQSAAKLIDPLSFYEQMAHRIVHGRAPQKDNPHSHEG